MEGFESIKHEVAWKTLNVRHLIEFSPSAVSIAKEIRYTVIAVAFCVTTISAIHLLSSSTSTRRSDKPLQQDNQASDSVH